MAESTGKARTLAEIRRRLAGAHGRAFWRSLDEAAAAPEFRALLRDEFPRYAAPVDAGWIERRDFLKLMGASLALAGLGGCTRQPPEKIVPYVRQPEHLALGEPLEFATAMPLGGYALGVLVESHDGRPTKIEGNPLHPASLGGSDATMQASILGLYDPDRAQVVTSAGAIRTWGAFRAALAAALAVERARRGAGLRILTETITSPTLAAGIASLLSEFPAAQWHQWEPTGRDAARAGARLAFGVPVETSYRFDQAAVVVALDADIFGSGPAHVRYARDVMRQRRGAAPSRLYVIESVPTITGAAADHRLPLGPADIERFARALARAVGVSAAPPPTPFTADRVPAFITALAGDLAHARGASVVIAGDAEPPVVHALAHAINGALGNLGRTVVHTDPVEAAPTDQLASLQALTAALDAGAVELLLILGGNPVYTAPADLAFGAALDKAALRVHLGPYDDETSALCHWHVPEAHYLESWGDVRAYDGTATILQPLITPLYGGKTADELLAACLSTDDRSGYDIVRAHWQRSHGGPDFEAFWRQSLHDGVVAGTARGPRRVDLVREWDPGPTAALREPARMAIGAATARAATGAVASTGVVAAGDSVAAGGGVAADSGATADGGAGRVDVLFRADPYLVDGRFANNGWLQELPRPISMLTWDNAALLAPATAERLGVHNDDVVEIAHAGRTLTVPVWIVPGHAPDTVTLHLGYGRSRGGRVAAGVGANAYALRTTTARDVAAGARVRPTGATHRLATTQEHQLMEGRDLIRVGTVDAYRADPTLFAHAGHAPAADMSLYPPVAYDGHAWGMAIDLAACIGCHACAAACQAENNIPVVGKTEILRGHEMHWIRIDRYYEGDLDAPAILHQPVPCMHCENAPCEVVCPVNATVHSSEGLNEMVYNRCVGTRYCSNNCPYKVRRFNFFLSSSWRPDATRLVRNPDVTVRSRGVMEKCTYCVQRIERARIAAGEAGRSLGDGAIVTACQQACPTEAIVFGDINDPSSRVARLKAEPRNYGLLADRNTRPRTTYLAALRNPNPALRGDADGGHA